MTDSLPNLLETFNAAAKAAGEDRLPMKLFVAHYLTAMRHGTSDPDEKRSLTKTIFDAAHGKLDTYAEVKNAYSLKNAGVQEEFSPMLEAMCLAECIDFLPRDAAKKLATIAIKMSTTASVVNNDNFTKWEHLSLYQTQAVALAELALRYADKISQPRPEPSVETSKDIAPVKRITLKPAEGTQP